MESLGLGPSVVCSLNPSLIYARLTGYGQHGDLSRKAGHDINYLSYSGILSMLGREQQKPHAPINLLADFAGGGLMCSLAIIAALYERLKSNDRKGKVIDLSMVEGAAYVGSWLWTSSDIPSVWGQERGKNLLDGGHLAYDTYECADGKFIAVGALEPQFYNRFLQGL
jgi:alpha-methylacyl-CoA racemase